MDGDERRNERDAGKLRNVARLVFRNFFGQMENENIEISNCSGTLKSLDEDLKNVIRKIDHYTEDTREPMENGKYCSG